MAVTGVVIVTAAAERSGSKKFLAASAAIPHEWCREASHHGSLVPAMPDGTLKSLTAHSWLTCFCLCKID